jgi:hypothetical protein
MSALDPLIYSHVLIGRMGTATLFPATYLAMGGAAASSERGSRGSLPTVLLRSGRPRGGIATVAGFLWAVPSEGAQPGSPLGSVLRQPGA